MLLQTSITDWNRELQERVGQVLRPERIQSLLMILPGASGDVALSTTVIRHVKHINPECHVTYATKKVNIPIARMCPGVSDTLELPNEPVSTLSRRRYLDQFAGKADAVIYPGCAPEDIDLIRHYRYTLLETLWMLSGLEREILERPQQVWLTVRDDAQTTKTVIERSVAHSQEYLQTALQSIAPLVKNIPRPHSLRGSGIRKRIRDARRLLRHGMETLSFHHRRRLRSGSFERDFVVLSTQSNSLPCPPPGVTATLVRALRRDGRTVLHNVLDPREAAAGTMPLVCSYNEFLALRQAGVPFVGWRSGLCDIAIAAAAPMCVLYPPAWEDYEEPLAAYGLKPTNAAANCMEFVCRSAEDVTRSGFIAHLHER